MLLGCVPRATAVSLIVFCQRVAKAVKRAFSSGGTAVDGFVSGIVLERRVDLEPLSVAFLAMVFILLLLVARNPKEACEKAFPGLFSCQGTTYLNNMVQHDAITVKSIAGTFNL
jgi:hypothetical protein